MVSQLFNVNKQVGRLFSSLTSELNSLVDFLWSVPLQQSQRAHSCHLCPYHSLVIVVFLLVDA
jgi:hypothetical protein